jgi:hypothetical protein
LKLCVILNTPVIMAKLESSLLPKIKSSSLARVKNVTTVAEAVKAVCDRARMLTLIPVQAVLDRHAVAGVVPQGLPNAQVLTGKDGSGRPHVSVRTNFALATAEQIEQFCAGVSTMQTIDAVQEAYYSFIDEVSIPLVVWDNEPGWAQRASNSSWTGTLRADAVTGNVSISGATPEKPAVTHNAKKLDAALAVGTPAMNAAPIPPAPGTPTPPPAPQPVMKLFNGTPYSVADLLANNWSQAAIDALPNA